MASISAWLTAFRLRTLPLSLSAIILGSLLAAYHGSFHWAVFIGAVLTTLFLQILSNLANDYGDAVHGVDNQERTGPKRGLQTGAISLRQMKSAILIFILLALASGIWLIIVGMKGLLLTHGLLLFLLGIAAIVAALKYTMGKNPYGYAGWGDVSVFLFFGLVGVLGVYFLHTHELTWPETLPAVSIGCFSAGVLNLNNLRDRENDRAFGKHTLVVKLGAQKAKGYHAALLLTGMLSAIAYSSYRSATAWQWLYLLSFIGFVRNMFAVYRNRQPELLDPELKKLALSTLAFALLFGLGLII